MPNNNLELVPKIYDDNHLLQGMRLGSDAWFRELYTNSYRIMYWSIRNKGANHDETEDIIQDAIMITYEKVSDTSFVLTSKLTTYVLAIGNNIWLKECRRRGNMVIWDNQIPDGVIVDEEDYKIKEDRYSAMEDAFVRLDDECQKILRKRYWEKESFAELSNQYNKSENSLKMKSSRCHDQLYTWLINKI